VPVTAMSAESIVVIVTPVISPGRIIVVSVISRPIPVNGRWIISRAIAIITGAAYDHSEMNSGSCL